MRICIPIRAKTVTEAKNLFKKVILATSYLKKNVKAGGLSAVFIELWLDYLSPLKLKNIIKNPSFPVIAVCRSPIEKGSFLGKEKERIERLCQAILYGAAFVDLSVQTKKTYINQVKKACKKHCSKLIISQHFWPAKDKKHPSLSALLKSVYASRKNGADIVKIATSVYRISDNAILFELTGLLASQKNPAVIIGMGQKGYLSRLGCPLLGSYLTYVALSNRHMTAEGQVCMADWQFLAFLVK